MSSEIKLREKRMNIKKEYKKSWIFIKECKVHIIAVVILFFVSVIIGFLFPVFFVDFIKKFIEEISGRTVGMNYVQLFLFILQNNLFASVIGMISGILIGVIPLFYAWLNGYVLGFVMNKTVAAQGASVLLNLLPHGVFEMPALFLSLALGLKIGWFVFGKGDRKKNFYYILKNAAMTFILIVIPLLIIAAIIEAGLIVLLG